MMGQGINNNGELNWHHGQSREGRKIEIKSHEELSFGVIKV